MLNTINDVPWFEQGDEAELAGGLKAEVDRLMVEDESRLTRLEANLRLYGGTRARCIRPWENPSQVSAIDILGGNADKLRLNVVKAAIDTIVSKVGKLRPRPTFLTNGADWSVQVRAKNLQRFCDGAYHQADTYELAPDVFRDAMVLGTGVTHTFTHGRRIRSERVPVWELFVDRADAMYGSPRCIYRVKWVANAQVAALFPGKVVPEPDPKAATYGDSAVQTGYTRVVEAWALPTCPVEEIGEYRPDGRRKDNARMEAMYCGRHVLLVGDDQVVANEHWKQPEFPFTFLHWSKPTQGFWGDSAVVEVAGIQTEVNRLIQHVQEAMKLTAQPFVFVHPDAVLAPAEITNLVAQVFKVEANVPLDQAVVVHTFQSVHQQVMQHLWMLYAKAFEILGSNQLAASASAPPGLESGRALEQLAEEHSERFMTVSRHFEHVLGELQARQFIRCAKQIDARLKADGHREGFVIRAPNGRVAIQLKWADVAIDEDAYIIQVFPTSVLPTTPAARIQEVERMAAAGWVDPAEARRMLDFPDLRANTDLATADEDNLMRQLELMLEQGKFVQPEPYQDLAKAIRVATQSILRAQCDGVPDDHIDLVRDFITSAEALLKRTAQPSAAMPVPAGVFDGAATTPGTVPAPAAPGTPPTPT